MKKVILSGLAAALVCVSANASDGGLYLDTERVETRSQQYVDSDVYTARQYVAPRAVVDIPRPCAYSAGNPFSVKTHTEVIDHYQMYQPVVTYMPAGTYSQRRVVENPRPRCGRCGY